MVDSHIVNGTGVGRGVVDRNVIDRNAIGRDVVD
jgi:hypothetical protein